MNELIRNFEKNLFNLISNCNLPPSITYYILMTKTLQIKEIYSQQLFDQLIEKEMRIKEQEKVENKDE